jgi:murein L,D-transpeptidase YcbB/YkuD
MRRIWAALLLVTMVFVSCKYIRNRKTSSRDTSINHTTSFNNVFLDSNTVEVFLGKHAEFASFSDQYADFYNHRNYEFAWFDTTGVAEQTFHFLNLQNAYIAETGDSSLANPALSVMIDTLKARTKRPFIFTDSVKTAELSLTGQFFRYAAKVYKGSDIDAEQLGWFIPRKKISLSSMLDSTLKSKNIQDDPYAPLNVQYKKLQEQLNHYLSLQGKEAADSIPYTSRLLKKGTKSAIIPAIKERLVLLGDLSATDSTETFDSTLYKATKQFQRRMGLQVDGVIGNRMIAEMNVPVAARIQQLLVNRERARWMPAEKDSNYILVNIPEYKMHVIDSARPAFDMNVIVGTAANSTTIFNGNLKYIVFSPYWNVPESIVKKEIMPAMKSNPGYIAKNNMEITGYSGKTPIVRQKPGGNNSLGLVKFLFPNNYNIYFHDTPNRELFSQSSRSFSHGCIRLGEPKKFAQYLLRADSSWTSPKIDSLMHLTKEKWVTLNKSIPVFIVYFTAWVDKDGQLNFRKDIYGHDAKMQEKLFTRK